MITFLTVLSFLGIVYAYFGYPLILIAALKGRTTFAKEPSSAFPCYFSVIITARNEERNIAAKLDNTLAALEHVGGVTKHEVIVASDASDDGTDSIVESYATKGVRLVRSSERKGKEWSQALAIGEARGNIIFFTDVKVKLAPDSLFNLQSYFSDIKVGAVSSVDRVEAAPGESSGEGMYVRYEMWLRRLETMFFSVVGLSGSGFAVRKEIAEAIRKDIPSDFSLLMEAIRRGFRGVLAEDVICTYSAVRTEEEEFSRKVRTLIRGLTALFSQPEMMDPRRYGVFAWQMISHKLLRWLVPWFVLIFFIGCLLLGEFYFVALIFAYLTTAFFTLAYLAYLEPSLRGNLIFKVPLFFTITNLAIAIAWVKFIKGERTVSWNPSAKV